MRKDRINMEQTLASPSRIHHGPSGIQQVGHRRYVGGIWDGIGRLQFDFLVANGLLPNHYLLDIACGCLRGGVHFVPFLEPGHYLGIDKEEALIQAGIEEELTSAIYAEKRPQLIVSDALEFQRFGEAIDFALAQSLFTHLPPELIELCFQNLRVSIRESGTFFATFFEAPEPVANSETPHDHGKFLYTREQMEDFGTENGWKAAYIGDWEHPRNQKIVRYCPT